MVERLKYVCDFNSYIEINTNILYEDLFNKNLIKIK